MRKRLLDIYPPNTKESIHFGADGVEPEDSLDEQPQRSQIRFNWNVGSAFLTGLFIIGLVSVHVFFAQANVEIWPAISKLRITETITAQIGYDGLNFERRLIGARLFEEEVEQSLLIPASGTKMKEEKAQGTIRVYNEQKDKTQALVANTRFISEDGKLFRSTDAISIPAATSAGPGKRDVLVIAAEPGEEYNIANSQFSLPGLVGSPLYTKVHGESLTPMTGGIKREVAIANEEDIASAREKLTAMLKTEGTTALLAKVPPQFQVLTNSLETTFNEDNSLIATGAELEQFTYRGTMKVSMLGFHKEDANLLVEGLIESKLGPEEAINENTLQVTYRTQTNTLGESGTLPLTVEMNVDQYIRVDSFNLENQLRGVSKDRLSEVFSEYPFFAQTRISLWPFWVSRVPSNSENIKVKIQLEN